MSWLYLCVAVVFEVLGTTCMKMSDTLTRLWPSIGMFVFYGIAFIFLSFALKKIPVSVAYAIWSGIGIVLITVIDIYIFRTDLSSVKIFGIALILIGAIMLKVVKV